MKHFAKSFWVYTILCIAAVSLFGWHELNNGYHLIEFSSLTDEEVLKKINQANNLVSKMTSNSGDDMKCTCSLGDQKDILTFEDSVTCGSSRNYLQRDIIAFKKADTGGFFSKRDYVESSKILPRKCVLFVMRKFWKDKALNPEEKLAADLKYNETAPATQQRPIKNIGEYKPDKHLFSFCRDTLGEPTRYGHKACVTEDYVNLTYNSLLDVTDCLQVPIKFVMPKLFNESGLHVNAFGMLNDGGIGQFTEKALHEVRNNYDSFKKQIVGSSKPSCKRLISFPGALPERAEQVLHLDKNRCHVIGTPPNPLRSLVYYGMFYHATKKYSAAAFDKNSDSKDSNFKSIASLMKKAGIAWFDKDAIKKMLFVMSYNAGPSSPATFFREWLKYRITQIKKYPILKKDFEMAYWPAQVGGKTADDRIKAVNKGKRPFTFAEYLFVYKNSLYIPAVRMHAKKLDDGLGKGTCTENKFLEL